MAETRWNSIPNRFGRWAGSSVKTPQRHLDRGAIVPPRHKAILDPGGAADLAHQHDAGDRQNQNDDETHQRRGATLFIFMILVAATRHPDLSSDGAKVFPDYPGRPAASRSIMDP